MPWTWLGPWRAKPRATRHLTLYTRRGCHLCEEAGQVLDDARHRYGFTLTTVDVDGDPTLTAAHGECVPVVAVDGKVRFRGRVNRVLLERLLRSM